MATKTSAGLLERLEDRVRAENPLQLADGQRVAYWLNAYNLTLLRALATSPRSGHLLRHRGLFRTTARTVGGRDYSLDVIEHGLLRGNRRPPYSLRRTLRPGDPRLDAAPGRVDPRIHFALNCGARSCPPVRVYTDAVDSELEAASRSYLEGESELDRERNMLTLPGLMRLYRADFGGDGGILEFAAAHLNGGVAGWINANAGRLRIDFARFDWRLEDRAR